MKARWLHTDAQLNVAKGTIEELEAQLTAAQSDAARLQVQLDDALNQLTRLQEKTLSASLHAAAYSLAVEEFANAQKRMEQSAETMADYAATPQDIAFTQAVMSYQTAKERRRVCEQVIKGLEALTEEGGAA